MSVIPSRTGEFFIGALRDLPRGEASVASDEANNGSGKFDEWKRQRLLGVGADVVIPNYRDAGPLLDRILGA